MYAFFEDLPAMYNSCVPVYPRMPLFVLVCACNASVWSLCCWETRSVMQFDLPQVASDRRAFIVLMSLYILAMVVVAVKLRKVKEVFNIKPELCGTHAS